MASNPYKNRPEKSFWRRAVSDRSYFDLEGVSNPLPLSISDKFATAGSCFAQHIGRNLVARGAICLDMEPAPTFLPEADWHRFGYGIYSARYGNIYTARQLLQLTREALEGWTPVEPVWVKDGRFYDSRRPSVDPTGHATADAVLALRAAHLEAFRHLLTELDVFVFTLGLTEAWQHRQDGCVFPVAPGVICGDYSSETYEFVNFDFPSVHSDLLAFRDLLKSVNPGAHMLLTVSPVPLIATASSDHVMVATSYSKSTLRSVAGALSDSLPDCHYFPSFEIISAHPSRSVFFDPDLRTVNARGVDFVMGHFFQALDGGTALIETVDTDVVCDEERIEQAGYTNLH